MSPFSIAIESRCLTQNDEHGTRQRHQDVGDSVSTGVSQGWNR